MVKLSFGQKPKVLVVGAGPIGLAAALEFANFEIETLVVDELSEINRASKAICWSQRSLEILNRVGLAEQLIDKGSTWKKGRVFKAEEEIYNFDLQVEAGFKSPAFINLQQYYVEQFLIDKLQELEYPVLRRGHKVVDIAITNDERALVQIEHDQNVYIVTADYVVAADGVRSTIRKAFELEMRGNYFDEQFLIIDVKVDKSFPLERKFWFQPTFHDGQSALLHVQPDNILRIDLQLEPNMNPELEKDEERVRARVNKILGSDVAYKLEWISLYSFSCKRIQRFRHGPIFFVGDAAHVVSPFGARGGNGGLQDIDNLVWKVSSVINGKAPRALLDSYDEERIPAADENLLNSARSTGFMTPKTQASIDFREAVFDLSKTMPFAREFINSGRLSQPYKYFGSSLVSEDDISFCGEGILPGQSILDAPIFLGRKQTWLIDQITIGFSLVVFVDEEKTAKSITKYLDEVCRQLDLLEQYLVVTSKRFNGISKKFLCDTTGLTFERWAASDGSVYLVRPDHHVAARWKATPTISELKKAFRKSISL
jgi:3-(3-hydroxy-phenyl)propionate hydroxylase